MCLFRHAAVRFSLAGLKFGVQFDAQAGRVGESKASKSQPTSGDRRMRDYQAQIEKLRKDAVECALIRDLATDKHKRDTFDRLAVHLSALADQVELAMLEQTTG
jgi:hypothetical protein